MKSYVRTAAIVAALILPLPGTVLAGGSQSSGFTSPQQALPMALPAPVGVSLAPSTGSVFTVPACQWVDPSGNGGLRPSLAVGMNNYGTFIDALSSTATGFQVPAGAAQESLAAGWFGEGWFVDFGAGFRSYYLSGPQMGPIELVDDYSVDSSRYTRYLATVFLPVSDNSTEGVTIDFEFVIDKQVCDVTLRTTIENDIPATISIDYKRVVDWDVYFPSSALGFSNCWESVPNGVRAWIPLAGGCTGPIRVECDTNALGYKPYAVDLDAWDDLGGPAGPGGSYVTSYGVPILGDYNAGFNYKFTLAPGGSWSTFLNYTCTAY